MKLQIENSSPPPKKKGVWRGSFLKTTGWASLKMYPLFFQKKREKRKEAASKKEVGRDAEHVFYKTLNHKDMTV